MTAVGLTIRLASADDAESVSETLRAAFDALRPQYTERAYAATTPPAEIVRERINEGPVWIASIDGEMIGTVSAVAQGAALYVRSMAVLPRARGHRVGEALLRNVEAFAREHRIERMLLSTTPFLFSAIRLYERYGFQRTPEKVPDLFGTPLVGMEKLL